MQRKLLKFYITLGYFALPLMVFADIDQTIRDATRTMQLLIAALFILATLVFLWGVIKFISAAGDSASREKAKGIMTWGIIGLAVMAAAWGIAEILIDYIGADTSPTFVNPPRI